MRELILIANAYVPNTAQTNRLLALAKGIIENGVSLRLVFVHPGDNFEKLSTNLNLKVEYLWDKHRTNNKVLSRLYGFWDIFRFTHSLKPDSKVFLYGAGQFLPILIKSKAQIYHERTEHPSVVKIIPHFMQKKYLASCSKLSGMFVISTALKQYFESIGVRNVNIINMVVDETRFVNLKEGEGGNDYIIYCGKATNNKDGVNDLIRAFAIVASEHKDIELKIVGKAPNRQDGYENLRLVEKLGLKNRVDFMGIKPSSEVPQLLKNARACVLDRPDSLQAQCGFPTKLGEYLLSGRPVIITKVGDIPLFLSHRQNALLANERDAEDFATQISWVLDNPKDAALIGERGKALAENEFNYLNESQKIVKVIFNE